MPAITIGLLLGSAFPVIAQDDEGGTGNVVSPGPLGKSTSDWHTEYLDWWLRSHGDWIERLDADVGIDCSGGDHGDVFFLPAVPPFLEGVSIDCQIGSDHAGIGLGLHGTSVARFRGPARPPDIQG